MKKFIESLFDKEIVNSGRQYEVDLLRGFSFILLCICHVGLYFTVDTTSPMFYFADLIGSEPCAPVLMTLMGLCIVFSKKQDASYLFKRGIRLLVIGYLLNFYRSCPYWIIGEKDYFACIPGFFVIDIFQFAGTTFLFLALFKKLKLPYWGMFVISLIFLIIGDVLMSIPGLLDISIESSLILNLFLPLDNLWCCFNMLTWLIYPCFGLILGELLIRCKNKDKFYLCLLVLGFIGFITLYLNIILRFPNYVTYYKGNNYYRMGILNSIVTILLVCFFLSFWYFAGKILPLTCKKFLTYLSKNISIVYVISWLILSPICHIQACLNIEFSVIVIIALMIGVITLSFLLSFPGRKIKNYLFHKNA